MPLSLVTAKHSFKPSTFFPSASGAFQGAGLGLALLLSQVAAPGTAQAAATATATSLVVSTAGKPVTSSTHVSGGTVITLTATVTAGAKAVSPGQVDFCEAAAKSCADIHRLATVQLTAAGKATYSFRPGKGNPSYKAVFAGTNKFAGSASSSDSFWVVASSGPVNTTTAVSQTGGWGNYKLTGTVTETGVTSSILGSVSFLNTSNKNAVLKTAALGASVAGIAWPSSLSLIEDQTNTSVAIGDFNGDGIPDIASASGSQEGPLTVFLGNADGTYTTAAPTSFSAYLEFSPMVVADFNGDGNQDLALLDFGNSRAVILLGNGDGTFNVSSSNPALGSDSNYLATGDYNGDGIPDLVVAGGGPNFVTVLLGKGDGTFTAAPASPALQTSPIAIAIGDFNGDGKLDMAFTDAYDDAVAVLLGKGNGSFEAASTLHCGSSGSPIVTADFNGDGILDLAVGVQEPNGVGDAVTILQGHGDGTFSAPAASQVVSSTDIASLVVGDFNADGVADLAVGNSQAGTFTILLGKRPSGFSSTVETLPRGSFYGLALAAGDLDGDGRTDLTAAYDESLLAYLTKPTETASATASLSLPLAGQYLVKASFGGNARYNPSVSGTISLWGVPPATKLTLKLTSGAAAVTSVKPGTVITLTAAVSAGASPESAGQMNFCDASAPHCTGAALLGTSSVTGKGIATLKFAPGSGQHTFKAEFLEEGDGKSALSNTVDLEVGPAVTPRYSATTTIDTAGYPGNYTLSATVEGFGGAAAPTGKVSFVDTSFHDTVLATAELEAATPGIGWLIRQTPAYGSKGPIAEATGDFNGDGIPDVAVLWSSSPEYTSPIELTVFTGKGDGTFTAGRTIGVLLAAPVYLSVVAADLNGDGKLDLAVLSRNETKYTSFVTALPGTGDGTFGKSVTSAVYDQGDMYGDGIAGSLVAGDFNGDGKMDLAVVGDYDDSGGLTIMLGNGDGSFTPAVPNIGISQGFNRIATGDFNGDGIPDLVATVVSNQGGATVFLGKGDGTFTEGQQLTGSTFASSIVVGDFNDDGKLDLAIGDDYGITVQMGNGNGTFHAAPAGSQGAELSLVAGDFNGDGKLDLAGIDNSVYPERIDLFLGMGDGTFKEMATTPSVSTTNDGPFQIVAADFNKDGVPDLVMLTNDQNTATALLNVPTETETVTVTGIAPIGGGTHNVEAIYAGDSHYAKKVTNTLPLTAGLEPPAISPASGSYTTQQKVTITEAIPGATIYYQAGGTVNTAGVVQYTGPFFLPYGGLEQITAFATETGYQQSGYTVANLNLNLPAAPKPVLSPVAGSYATAQMVTITDTAPNANIYYTTNGEYPSVYATAYTGPITVSASQLVAAIAIAPGYSVSSLASAQFLIDSSKSRFIYTVAGTQSGGYSGDGGPATFASFADPWRVARNASGDLYIADEYTVRKVAAGSGTIATVAGDGVAGYSGDGGPAIRAHLGYVENLALDKAGDLYISDGNNCVVRKVTAATGIITTIAGSKKCGTSAGDDGPGKLAVLNSAFGVAVDKAGNLYIGTSGSIREVVAATGKITTIAGTGFSGYTGDGGPAKKAQISEPLDMVFDASGNLYFADSGENVIRKIAAANSTITTVAGTGPQGQRFPNNGDGGPATEATLNYPEGLAVDAAGNLFISDTYNGAIREVTASNRIIETIAGNSGGCSVLGGDGGPALAANLCDPGGLTVDAAGNLYVADPDYETVREITAPTAPPTAVTAPPVLSLAPGTYPTAKTLTMKAAPGAEVYLTLNGAAPTTSGEGYYTPITIAGPVTVNAIALEPGHLPSTVVTATYNVTTPATATIATVAGSGLEAVPGSGGPALQADFGYLWGVATDSVGNVYFADPDNFVVWKLNAATQTVSVVAGTLETTGRCGLGVGGPATNTTLCEPGFVAVDAKGNLYISDLEAEKVYKVNAATGILSIYAGGGSNYNSPTYGDGGPATSATLNGQEGIALDKAGNLYIADSNTGRIRRVDAATGIIKSVAGNSTATSLGDGGPALSASLAFPDNLAFDSAGNLYIVDAGHERIRMVAAKTQIITTVAGNGILGSSGDGGPATAASIGPFGIAVSADGTIYFSNVNSTIREFVPGGHISTLAGTGYFGFSGDGGPPRMGEICGGSGMAVDKTGSLFIGDGCNFRVRKVSFPKP